MVRSLAPAQQVTFYQPVGNTGKDWTSGVSITFSEYWLTGQVNKCYSSGNGFACDVSVYIANNNGGTRIGYVKVTSSIGSATLTVTQKYSGCDDLWTC
jgi:hypothetical protein